MLVVGTYYGQWVSGLRHGFGVRQSAPFSVATPVRHDDQRLRNMGAAGRRPHHHNSMPALNSSLPLSPVDVSTTQQPVEKWVADYGRSGFVLVGDSGRDATSARRHPRSRSSSLRRTVADTFSSIVRKRKPDAKTDDRPTFAQVSFGFYFFHFYSFIYYYFFNTLIISNILKVFKRLTLR